MWPEASAVVLVAHAVQTFGAAVIAILLFGFLRQYGKSYLAHWTASWTSLAVYQLAAGIGLVLAVSWRVAPTHPLRVASSLVAGLAGYLQIAWLLFGVYELLRRRPVRIVMSRQILATIALLGGLSAVVFIEPVWPAPYREFVRVGIRALLAAAVYFAAAVGFWEARTRRQGIGFVMTAGAFLLYGLEELHYVALAVASLAGYIAGYVIYLGY